MRFRDQVALTLPALVLRLVLAVVFLWAGIGKFASTTMVTGDDAARLHNLNIQLIGSPADQQPPEPVTNLPEPDATVPDESIPNVSPEDQQRLQELVEEAQRRINEQRETTDDPQSEPATDPDPEQVAPPTPIDPEADHEIDSEVNQIAMLRHAQTWGVQSVQDQTTPATASDFPHEVAVRRVHMVSLMLDRGANPGLTPESQPIEPTLPSWVGGSTARYLAMLTAVVEILAGGLLLLGFMTRLSSLGTLVVMVVAMWMTQFGPAAIQSDDALLGFIPNHGDFWDISAYTMMLLQLALAAMSIAVLFLGSGPIGMDRVIFGASKRDKYIHGDPKAAPPVADRGHFDRSPNPTP